MKKVKLTKTGLKKLTDDLKRFNRYLPTLLIKKQLLQIEVSRVKAEAQRLSDNLHKIKIGMDSWVALLGEDVGLADLLEVDDIITRPNNIAGVDIPIFIALPIQVKPYDLFSSPLWLDRALAELIKLMRIKAENLIIQRQYLLLEQELRLTSQRVNLFEKIKIPQAMEQIRTIAIYLADQQAAAVGWARIAKNKIREAT